VRERPSPPPAPGEDRSVALALVNTEAQAGGRRIDLIPDERAARDWLARHGLAPPPGSDDVAWRDQLHALREALGEVLRATAEQRSPPREDLRRLNAIAARVPGAHALAWHDGAATADWQPAGRPAPVDVVLARIAEDGIQLAAAEAGSRLRKCGAHDCVRMLVQDDPRRVWCSRACGDRMRVARHYEKVRRSRGQK